MKSLDRISDAVTAAVVYRVVVILCAVDVPWSAHVLNDQGWVHW